MDLKLISWCPKRITRSDRGTDAKEGKAEGNGERNMWLHEVALRILTLLE